MLPAQLLRAKIRNKGKNIEPLFCAYSTGVGLSAGDDIHLAAKLIEEFNESWKNRDRSGLLSEKVSMLEEQYGDYKLVRGLYTLLQRRCIFSSKKGKLTETNNRTAKTDLLGVTNQEALELAGRSIDPFNIRRQVFEESSKRGFALTDSERSEIMNCVASRLGISTGVIVENMWNDLEDNLIIEHFFKLNPTELVGWYNLSLVQTLLFNCTHLEFFVKGGLYWKRVLRDLKRLGLMYYLEQRQELAGARKQSYRDNNIQNTQNWLSSENNDTGIVCSVSGPLSIFKLTDRYGTSIAKLLPSIVSAGRWFIKAWIVRKNFTSGKRIYEFELSEDKSPLLLREPIRDDFKMENSNQWLPNGNIDSTSNTYYDSKVEENFAKRFTQSVKSWTLTREPDTIVLSNGKALIPDFMFEKYDKKIYFEIVGFWTREYLEKKLEKIRDITMTEEPGRPDFLMAVNSDYYAASGNSTSTKEKPSFSQIFNFIEKNHLIRYKGNDIPLKPILEYLKYTEQVLEQEIASRHSDLLLIQLRETIETSESQNTVIPLEDIAKKCRVPVEAVLRIIKSEFPVEKSKNENYQLDQRYAKFIIVGKFLIPTSKVNELRSILDRDKITQYNEASLLFAKNGIPDECHSELISKLGFEIVWKGIDYNNATIEKNIDKF
jgi:predicted nuclease of restriction endonuclease-like RecB superfamily